MMLGITTFIIYFGITAGTVMFQYERAKRPFFTKSIIPGTRKKCNSNSPIMAYLKVKDYMTDDDVDALQKRIDEVRDLRKRQAEMEVNAQVQRAADAISQYRIEKIEHDRRNGKIIPARIQEVEDEDDYTL